MFQNIQVFQPETRSAIFSFTLRPAISYHTTMADTEADVAIEHPLDLETLKTFIFDRVLSESMSMTRLARQAFG